MKYSFSVDAHETEPICTIVETYIEEFQEAELMVLCYEHTYGIRIAGLYDDDHAGAVVKGRI